MIVSYSKHFIFIKTRKTAGTSVEIALSPACSGDDICTPISAKDELLRAKYGGRPMNFCRDRKLGAAYLDAIATGNEDTIRQALLNMGGRLFFHAHHKASGVRRRQAVIWQRALTFAVERHPYEKVISAAYWSARREQRASGERLQRHVERLIKGGGCANYPLYMENNQVLVNRILRYENLWEELDALNLGVDLPKKLPQAKVGYRLDRRPAEEILSRPQKRRVYESMAIEFELMGYAR